VLVACINPDGSLTGAAKKIMAAMHDPISLRDVAEQTMLPLYRIRSSVREILQAGLVEEKDGAYTITAAGRELLQEQS
jgi:predicted transcriptional regulator